MSDLGLYQALERLLAQTFPGITIFGQSLPETPPPYIRLQLDPLEKSALPQKAARIKTTLHLTSRYSGEAEIQELHRKALSALEGASVTLEERAEGLIRFEESQIRLEKDGITRTGLLTFTTLIKLK